MIRVTLTNSKLDKELGRKKKTSTEDFLFSRKKLTAFHLPQTHIITFFVNAHKNHSGFIPPVIFTLILSRTQFSPLTLPLWPVFRFEPRSARVCSEGKTSRSIKRHHCFYHFLFKASLPHDTHR